MLSNSHSCKPNLPLTQASQLSTWLSLISFILAGENYHASAVLCILLVAEVPLPSRLLYPLIIFWFRILNIHMIFGFSFSHFLFVPKTLVSICSYKTGPLLSSTCGLLLRHSWTYCCAMRLWSRTGFTYWSCWLMYFGTECLMPEEWLLTWEMEMEHYLT